MKTDISGPCWSARHENRRPTKVLQ